MFLKKHWLSIVSGLLCLAVIVLGNNLVALDVKYNKALGDYEWARQSLKESTRQLVEVRKLLVLKEFKNYEELKTWVDEWETVNKPIVLRFLDTNYVLVGNDELYSDYWDCDDIAEAMQRDAIKDGWLMSVCPLGKDGSICDVKVSPYSYHAGCLTVAGNIYWFIEPQNGEIVKIVGRD